ncbi:hypothetical protein [uncultured Cyclobacterium sp.]|uniref:hypothetical protein n=1 Tax=uncultured Cyclobacterium sp. TaxID=453820 RepID=UPI0030EC9A53
MVFPIRTLCLYVFSFLLTGTLLAQRGDGSLFSSYGIGLINNDNVGYSTRLGGTGVAVQSPYFLNHINPASSVGILGAYNFMIDADVKYQMMNISTSEESIDLNRTNLSHVAFWLKVSKKSAFTFGLMPISSVDNSFLETTYFVGSADPYSKYTKNYGDISKVFLNYAYALHPRLSLGVRPYYLFGHVNNTNLYEVQSDVNGSVDSFQLNLKNNYSGVGVDLGMQYIAYKKKDKKIILGLTYNAPANISEQLSEEVQLLDSDSLLFESSGEMEQMDFFQSAKAGISYQNKNWIIAADYVYKYFPDSWEDYTAAQQVSLGVEYVPDFYGYSFPKQLNYSAGLFYDTGNYLFQNTPVSRYGFTAGIGFPIQNLTRLTLSYQYEKQGSTSLLAKEITHGITVNFNLADIWFQKKGYK